MNIHEYQAKEILKVFNVPVPAGKCVRTAAQAEKAAVACGGACVVKVQIYAGGRGKAGGVKVVRTAAEARETAQELLKKKIVTKQTGPEGLPVKRLLLEELVEVEKEFYFSITLDRKHSRYCLIASAEGGMDIEEVARTSPEKIHTMTIDPCIGVRPYNARGIALALGLTGKLVDECIQLIRNLYEIVLQKDCTLLEINPLVLTRAGRLLAMDCKMNFDDNALFRHQDYEKMIDLSQVDPLETNSKKYDLSYIKLAGNIGCLVNGAGLAMATLDVLKEFGGEPANFLDIGGGASREKVAEALRIILQDRDAKGIFVNIFGGINRCDVIAQGIIDVGADFKPGFPVVVRMDGSLLEEGKRLLAESGLNVEPVDGLAEGARRIVQRIQTTGIRR